MRSIRRGQAMNHDSFSNQNLISSPLPIPPLAGLVGGERLSEQIKPQIVPSDSSSPPTSHNRCQNGLLTGSTLGSVTDSYTTTLSAR